MLNFLKHQEKPKFPEFPSITTTEGPTFPEYPQGKKEFPNLPEPKGTFLEEKHDEFPTYKPAFPQQVMPEPLKVNIPEERPRIEPKDELEIPIRKPVFKPNLSQDKEPPKQEIKEFKPIHSKEDSIFVKVEKYEEARDLLTEIQSKLEETQTLISELDKSKEDEELQLKSYQESINSVKQKLIEIERTLFAE